MNSKRNITLVTMDSLRADHCGFMGYEKDTTPMLDSLAEDGVVFENAFTPGPRTPSSMPAIMTGAFPSVQTGSFTWQSRWDRIRRHLAAHRTIAERLQEQGYTTIGVTANPWTQGTGFDRGFDHFVELSADDMDDPPLVFKLIEQGIQIGDLKNRFSWHSKREWLVRWQNQFSNITEAIEIAKNNKPFFLWLFLLDCHQPYMMSRDHRVESNVIDIYYGAFEEFRQNGDSLPERVVNRLHRAYRDSVRSADTFVQRLYNKLEADNPLFIFHSDHGEAFGEHGTHGHEQELFDENLHVPFLVHGLDHTERINDVVSLRALPSVISQLADKGQFNPRNATSKFVFATTENTDSWAVRSDRWKYVLNSGEYLYDLSTDPAEQINRIEEQPTVNRMFRDLVSIQQSNSEEKQRIGSAVKEGLAIGTRTKEKKI